MAPTSRGNGVDVESDSREVLDDRSNAPTSDWTIDLPSIVLLLILYTLQGIPMGLSGSIPFLLLDKVRARIVFFVSLSWWVNT